MSKKIKIIAIILCISISIGEAYAVWPWAAFTVGSTLRVVTSQGAKKIIARSVMSRPFVGQVIKGGLKGGSKKVSWKLGQTVAAGLGVYYLLADFTYVINQAETEIPVQDDAIIAKYSDGSSCFLVETYYKLPGTKFNYTTKFHFVIDLSTRTGNVTLTHSNVDMTGQMVPRVRYQIGNGSEQTTTCIPGYEVTYTVINGDESEVSITYMGGRADEDIDDWIDINADLLEQNVQIDIVTSPGIAVDAGAATNVNILEEPVYDPITQTYQDPQTGMDVSPVDLGEGDEMIPPDHPDEPFFDITPYELPEKITIDDVMEEYEQMDDPVSEYLQGFTIEGSDWGKVNIPVPFVQEQAVLDFTELDDVYSVMRAIIIAFAYLYGLLIFFKGS